MSTTNFKHKKIIEAIQLASKYPSIKRIGVFGSYARGDNDKTSDLDLLYDYDESGDKSTDDLLGYVEEIDGMIKQYSGVSKIDYVWYKGVLASRDSKFKDAVLNDVIWIYEKLSK